jgi:hypothetical protein
MRSLWYRLETCLEQHLPHRRRRDADAEPPEFAHDPFVSPVRVLLASRRISSRSERSSGGRPGLRCAYVQRRAISCRCQRSSVSGLNVKTVQAGRGSERLSDVSSARSACVAFGREACRRRIANSWRRTRISSSFERRGRASSHTNAKRFRTTRYTNDQSKRPSLDHGKSAEPSEPNALERARTSLRTLRPNANRNSRARSSTASPPTAAPTAATGSPTSTTT